MSCNSNYTVKSDRYTESNVWLGQQLDEFQKNSLPWVATASRVTLITASFFVTPFYATLAFTAGVAVAYQWPGTYDLNPVHMSIGCSNDYYELNANRQQSKLIGFIFTTITTLLHMRCHGRDYYASFAAYTVGQFVGKELNAFVNKR